MFRKALSITPQIIYHFFFCICRAAILSGVFLLPLRAPWQCEISNNRNNSIKRRAAIKIIAFFDHQPWRSRLWGFLLSWARLFWLNDNNNPSKMSLNLKSNLNITTWESITSVILDGLRLRNRPSVNVVILIFVPLQNRLAFFRMVTWRYKWHKTRGLLAYAITELLNFLNTLVNNDLNCIRNTWRLTK